ncbi:MAG: Rab family GTPase [Candidatus Hodarchaeota archaeon]
MSSFKLKVLLTGAKAVDKTRLFNKIIKVRIQANYKLTVGVDILTKDVEFRTGEIAILSIWDIRDQQRFEYIRSTFYKGAAGAILVFDLTREETYSEVKNLLTEIRQFAGENIPFVLIGNNVHLLKLKDKGIIRKEACEFARNEGGIYIEISPTSIDVLEEGICELTRRIINSRT